ncbi:hypothetical protein BOO69_12275 [Sulfitobacter alexandrii]|uniref:Uncharacterized protein n=1 Tax=Sulfitobacter alexandrii TaxID=1917485 RepID=A0A1J0WID3_9RHOB|nr:hypothetical protein [Sulfitobacter alexandrii]APE44095.1 hypothetical protein BOO69_12275 [Sulfitobacter alexandrii]
MRSSSFAALSAVVLAAGIPSVAASQSYEAINHLKVYGLSPTSFEVIEDHGEGARGMWCAAADYAINRLGVPRTTRFYVKSPRGRSQTGAGRVGVVFTTDASSLSVQPSRSVSVSVETPGEGLPIYHANQFCRDYEIELDRILFRHGRY